MKKIISLVYKLGFRPKQGSIFYSPSLSWKLGMAKAIEETAKVLKRKK